MDEAFRPTEKGSTVLSDPRHGKNTQHAVLAMLRQGAYGRLTGYEGVNDAEQLRIDPVMRRVVGARAKEREAASTSEMSRFETEMLSSSENLTALMIRVGHGSTLRGNWPESLSRRHQGQGWHDGAATQARIAAREVISV